MEIIGSIFDKKNTFNSSHEVVGSIFDKPKSTSGHEVIGNIFDRKKSESVSIQQKKPRSNLLFKTLDVINAPQYGIANTIKDLVDGGDFNAFNSFYKGLSLQEKTSISDVLTEVGWQPESLAGKITKGVVGFAGDVATDPLSYVGVGLVTNASKALKTAKAAGKVKWVKNLGWVDELGKVDKTFEILDKAGKVKKGSDAEKLIKAVRAQEASKKFGKVTDKAIEGLDGAKSALTYLGKEIPVGGMGGDIIDKAFMALGGKGTALRQFAGTKIADSKVVKKAEKIPGVGAIASFGGKVVDKVTNVAGAMDKVADAFSTKLRKSEVAPIAWQKLMIAKRKLVTDERTAEVFAKRVAGMVTKEASDIEKEIIKLGKEISKKPAGLELDTLTKNREDLVNKLTSLQNGLKKTIIGKIEKGEALGDTHTEKAITRINDILNKAYSGTHAKELSDIGHVSGLRDSKISKVPEGLKELEDVARGKFSQREILGTDIDGELIGFKGINIKNAVVNKRTGSVWTKEPVYELSSKMFRDLNDGLVDVLKLKTDEAGNVLWKDKKMIAFGKLPGVEASGEWLIDPKTKKIFLPQERSFPVAKIPLEQLDSLKTFNRTRDEINDTLGYKLFSTDITKSITDRAMRVKQTVAIDDFVKNITKEFGTKSNTYIRKLDNGKKVTQLSEDALKHFPDLKTQFFEPEIAKHINTAVKAFYEPEVTNKYIKIFDKIQNEWKVLATALAPAFHLRNSVSNTFQNFLGGVYNPKHYKQATEIMVNNRMNKLTSAQRKILKEFEKSGLGDIGRISGDIDLKELHGLFERPKGLYGKIKDVGGKAGRTIEDNAKLTHFIAKREAGLSIDEAADSVKKYLFDYKDLTWAEKNIMKRAFPFYSFFRKNLPMQVETLIKSPAKQTAIIKLKNNIEIAAGGDRTENILDEWKQEDLPIFIGKKNGKVRYVYLGGLVPAADLNRLSSPNNVFKTMIEMFTPVLKTPIEQSLNYNFFFGSKITGETKSGLGANPLKGWVVPERNIFNTRIGGRLDHLTKLFRPISEFEKLVSMAYPDDIKSQLKYDMDAKATRLLLGSVISNEDPRFLLKKFDRLTRTQESNIVRQINYLRDEMKKYPQSREQFIKDIKTLRELHIKSKRVSREERARTRNMMLSV